MAYVYYPSHSAIARHNSGSFLSCWPRRRSNPFYQRKLAVAGVDAEVASLKEFSERFPFTSKQEIAEDQKPLPYGTNLTFL